MKRKLKDYRHLCENILAQLDKMLTDAKFMHIGSDDDDYAFYMLGDRGTTEDGKLVCRTYQVSIYPADDDDNVCLIYVERRTDTDREYGRLVSTDLMKMDFDTDDLGDEAKTIANFLGIAKENANESLPY